MLRNKHIILRAVEPGDLELLYRWENNPAYWYAGELRSPYSRFVLKQYILSAGKDIYETKQIRFMIDSVEHNTTIGAIDLFDFDIFNERIAVGLLVDEPYRQYGFASMSLQLIKEYVFDYLKINQLYAHVAVPNEASRKLFEKNDFLATATLKNWIKAGDGFADVILFQLFRK